MKNTLPRHHRNGSSDWMSAFFTLLVLFGIYNSMDRFDSYTSLYKNEEAPSAHALSVSEPYWNTDMNYGFRSLSGDSYVHSGSEKLDQVLVSGDTSSVKKSVKVSFYPDTPIDEIEKDLDADSPRAYSRLSSGIAVIEGDLDSPSAKLILATLHSQ